MKKFKVTFYNIMSKKWWDENIYAENSDELRDSLYYQLDSDVQIKKIEEI